MGLISRIIGFVFGDGRNVISETAEVFVENAEGRAVREQELRAAVLAQFAAEFAGSRPGWFNRFMDGINRLPRPALALGTLGLFGAAMHDPVWFAARMQGLALVPEPLWWLMGAVVSFYFGARHQVKTQEFQRSVAEAIGRVPQVVSNLQALETIAPVPSEAPAAPDVSSSSPVSARSLVTVSDGNAALEDWRARVRQSA